MQITESSKSIKAQTSIQVKKLLSVGPMPPVEGSSLTVQSMLEDLSLYPSVQVTVINTSPAIHVRKNVTGFNFEKVKRSLFILPKYIYEIPRCDAVLVFANDFFAITLLPLLLLIARLFRKSFYINPVGAGLGLFINAQKKPFREYLLYVLRATDGILTNTRPLKDDLSKLGCTKVYYLPGCRPMPAIALDQKQSSSKLRVIFVGHITKLTGPFVLLNALKVVSEMSDEHVTCDFYGPIHNEIQDEFLNKLKSIPNAHYCGISKPGRDSHLIAQYDVLVLPATYHDAEEHPGALIDAMHAGVPVITTQVDTFPELITNGINGFLVPARDSYFLAVAIIVLAVDPNLRKKMGEANHLKGQEFRADKFAGQLLKIIFPDLLLMRQRN